MATEQEPHFIVNGRTLCITRNYDDDIIDDFGSSVVTSSSETGKTFFECNTIATAQTLYDALRKNDLNPRVVTYSLFFKSPDQLTHDEAHEIFTGMTSSNITYMRVDKNGYTGKLVVDVLQDYINLKSFDGDDDSVGIKFYRFKPKTNNRRKPN